MCYLIRSGMDESKAALIREIMRGFARSGGLAAAATMTEAERSDRASKASRARWRKYRAAQKKQKHAAA